MKYKGTFQYEWLSNELYKTWIKEVESKHKAYCKVSMKSFSVSGVGVKLLDIHALAKVSSFGPENVEILGK